MIPVVALVGRPNVGKSTLFNRFTRTRDALVADFPGLTRDRKYGRAKFADREVIVIDTGGIEGIEDGVEGHMADQSLIAIEEADIVLFLVDAKAGVMAADSHILRHLRVRQKATFLVVNKVDGQDTDIATADFHSLGMSEVFPIAAVHGRGISQLIDSILESLPEESSPPILETLPEIETESELENIEEKTQQFSDLPIKMAIVGRPNVGKSTLVNRILGEERVIVFDMPGTTRDSISIAFERAEKEYIIIDTAGVRKRGKVTETVEKFSVIKTLQSIEEANVVLLVIDAKESISDQDLSLLGFIIDSGRSLVIVINKWDGLSQDKKESIKKELDFRLGFVDFARVHFISALHGSGVGNLFKSIREAYRSATQRISTSLVTRIMQMAQDGHQPPLVRGRRVKLKYAHAGGYNPPIIVIHGNQVSHLPDSYKRYLINYFRRSLKIVGTPIQIQFNEPANPFAERRNKLSDSQIQKRKRLMKHVKSSKK